MSPPPFSITKSTESSFGYSLAQSQSTFQPQTPSSPASTCGTMSELPEKRNRHANTFLFHTYDILNDPKNQHIVCWNERGDSFLVKNPEALANTILPVHFKHSNATSFVRQLNIYGFHKIPSSDPNLWIFSHPKFRRDNREELGEIKRRVASEAVNRYKVAELSNEKSSLVMTVRQLQDKVESLSSTVHELQSQLQQSRSSEEKLKSELSTLVQYISALSAESHTETKKRRLMSEPPVSETTGTLWDLPSFDRFKLDNTPLQTPEPITERDMELSVQHHYSPDTDHLFGDSDTATNLFPTLSEPLLGLGSEPHYTSWDMSLGLESDFTALEPGRSHHDGCPNTSEQLWQRPSDGCKPEPESQSPLCASPSDIFGSVGFDSDAPFSINPDAIAADSGTTNPATRHIHAAIKTDDTPFPTTPVSAFHASSPTFSPSHSHSHSHSYNSHNSHNSHSHSHSHSPSSHNPAAMQQVHILADQLIRALAQVCHVTAAATAAAAAAAAAIPSRHLAMSPRPASPAALPWDPTSCIAIA